MKTSLPRSDYGLPSRRIDVVQGGHREEANVPKVVIVMPAYRAVHTLEKTVAAIPPGVADELLLVDDASPDGTAELARHLGLRVHVHATNRGYGGNQKTCSNQALQ